jgi:hypothetical protein
MRDPTDHAPCNFGMAFLTWRHAIRPSPELRLQWHGARALSLARTTPVAPPRKPWPASPVTEPGSWSLEPGAWRPSQFCRGHFYLALARPSLSLTSSPGERSISHVTTA